VFEIRDRGSGDSLFISPDRSRPRAFVTMEAKADHPGQIDAAVQDAIELLKTGGWRGRRDPTRPRRSHPHQGRSRDDSAAVMSRKPAPITPATTLEAIAGARPRSGSIESEALAGAAPARISRWRQVGDKNWLLRVL